VGNPFGFENSVTAGIVSAVDRQYGGGRGRSAIEGLIQTDTSINPGNSGGPLFNSAGEVIGINSMGVSPVRGSVGVGFAVPVNAAKRLLSRVGN
jgi:serine protease Do